TPTTPAARTKAERFGMSCHIRVLRSALVHSLLRVGHKCREWGKLLSESERILRGLEEDQRCGSSSFSRGPRVSADTLSDVLGALRCLARPGVTMGARTIEDRSMYDVERAHVRRATGRRVREFASGRALLRELIARDVPIPVGPDRAPVLPADVCGSLAH